MDNLLEIIDITNRIIFLTNERYRHIISHPEMQNKLGLIQETLEIPLKITNCILDEKIKYYYRYYKFIDSKAKFIKVIVKYLNGKGFIVTSYLVETIK